jgi:hypothetical protein
VGWNGSVFSGQVSHSSHFALSIDFTATINAEYWKLLVVYGPCQGQERMNFTSWLNNLQIPDDENWMLVGDFNFYRSIDNKNRDGPTCKISVLSIKLSVT